MTKNSVARATNPHISVIGHITKDELTRYLDITEACNGVLNRFLLCCVKRTHVLPDGGRIHEVDFEPYKVRLGEAVAFARGAGELQREATTARDIWHEVYPDLSEPESGLFGAATARAEAQVPPGSPRQG